VREFLLRALGLLVEPFVGRRDLWGRHKARLRASLPAAQIIKTLEDRCPSTAIESPAHHPVFIFSAGWRSGSTLVQRLLVSGKDLLVWGEPYSISDYVGHLAESLSSFSASYPPKEFFFRTGDATPVAELKEQWIAHLYPDVSDLRAAHQAFFLRLMAEPAAQRGYPRWGFKECKYGIEHAHYLKWLFPGSRFFFVYRNPLHAWRSFRHFGAYRRWPDDKIFTPLQFGRSWRNLMEGYLAHHAAVDGMMVKYEDLIAGVQRPEDLARFAEVRFDPSVLSRNVSGREQRRLDPVPMIERRLLASAVEPLAASLGYSMAESRGEDS
jgi:hypothetical protein